MSTVAGFLVFSLMLVVLAMVGCSDNATSVRSTGEIAGTVGYYGRDRIEFGDVKVTLEGTGIAAHTDSLGNFTLTGVPAGVYDIVFSRPGYASDRVSEFQFVGAGRVHLPNGVFLIPIPEYISASLDSLRFEAYHVITYRDTTIRVNGSEEHQLRYDTVVVPQGLLRTWPALHAADTVTSSHTVVCYFSANSRIDVADPSSYNLTALGGPTFTTSAREVAVETRALLEAGFHHGQTVFLVAFGGSSTPHYYDFDTRQTVFTGLSPHGSQVISFVMP